VGGLNRNIFKIILINMHFVSITENAKSIGKKFMRMVQQVVKSAKVTYSEIIWDMDPISEYFTI